MRGPHDDEIDEQQVDRDDGQGDHARERLNEFLRKRMPASDAGSKDEAAQDEAPDCEPPARKS
jgi:hypothetical protein